MDGLTTKDVKKFAQIEQELDLFSRKYNGFPYWQSIRFAVCESIFDGKAYMRTRNKRKSLLYYIVEIVKSIVVSIKEELFLLIPEKNDFLFVREAKTSDKFFDTWHLSNEIKSINYRFVPYEGKDSKTIHYLEQPRLKCRLMTVLSHIIKDNKDSKEISYIYEIEKRLVEEFGRCMKASEMVALIHTMKTIDRVYSKYYKRIIERKKCKAIIIVCYYSSQLLPLIKVAKENGIKVIEFQHGVINEHEEYWFEDRRGYNNYTPDILLTYGSKHNEWINLIDGAKAISVGYPYQEKCIELYKNVVTNPNLIVVYPDTDNRFEIIVNDFINEIVKYGYVVYIKPHPITLRNLEDYYPLLYKNKNASFIIDNKKSIYYWLKIAKHHIMASTTVGLEAVVYPHTNICIATNVLHHQTQCLLDWGIAHGFSSTNELLNLIYSPPKADKVKREYIKNELWASNSNSNIELFLNKFMKKKV